MRFENEPADKDFISYITNEKMIPDFINYTIYFISPNHKWVRRLWQEDGHDASVMHFLSDRKTAERLVNTLTHEESRDCVNDGDSGGYSVDPDGKTAGGIMVSR